MIIEPNPIEILELSYFYSPRTKFYGEEKTLFEGMSIYFEDFAITKSIKITIKENDKTVITRTIHDQKMGYDNFLPDIKMDLSGKYLFEDTKSRIAFWMEITEEQLPKGLTVEMVEETVRSINNRKLSKCWSYQDVIT